MKKTFVLFFVLTFLFSFTSNAQLLFEENFDYTIGQLTSGGSGANVSDSAWLSFSGTGFFIPVISGSLEYLGYPSSNIGNKVTIAAATTSAEDARRDFAQQTGDGTKIYASFLASLQSAPSNSSYFASLYSTATTGGGYRSRVYARPLNTGYELGFEGSGNTPVWQGVELAFNSTHLIVISYEFLAGPDSSKMWVDPSLSLTEPTPTLVYQNASDMPYCNAFALRQASTGGVAQNPDAEIDGIRVSTSWSDVVPVELVSFNASAIGSVVNLSWITATEINNNGFSIERQTGTSNWQTIGFVKGSGTTTAISNYNFADRNILSQKIYSYRLKQIDFDGTFSYSKVVQVSTNLISTFELKQNYPNPFNPSTQISFSLAQNGFVTLSVFNLLGQEVKNLVNRGMEAGSHSISFDASSLQSGVYIYKLTSSGSTLTRKMMLLK